MLDAALRLFGNLSLRRQLLVLTMLVSLPAFALILIAGFEQKRASLKESIVTGGQLVNEVAAEQSNLSSDAEQLLSVLALLPEVQGRDAPACSALFAGILKKSAEYGNVVVTDRGGDVWASGLPSAAPFSIASARSFQQAVKNRRFASGGYNIGKVSGHPTIGFGYPLMDRAGRLSGVVSVNFNFQRVVQRITRAGLPKGSSLTLVDYQGTVIYRNPDPGRYVGKPDRAGLFNRMKNGAEGASFTEGGEADGQLVAYRRLRLPGEPVPYLYVRVGIPLRETMRKVEKELLVNLAAMCSFLSAVVLAVVYVGKKCVIERLNRLQEASAEIAGGNLEARACLEGGELGKLGSAFDHMAEQLAEREAEREDLIAQLQSAAAEIKTLSGLLPICAYCKQIRDDQGYWNQMETYLSRHSDVMFSHGVCPTCADRVRKEIEELNALE